MKVGNHIRYFIYNRISWLSCTAEYIWWCKQTSNLLAIKSRSGSIPPEVRFFYSHFFCSSTNKIYRNGSGRKQLVQSKPITWLMLWLVLLGQTNIYTVNHPSALCWSGHKSYSINLQISWNILDNHQVICVILFNV